MSVETASLATLALSAGVLTFFSPCSYPLLPGYVAYFIGAGSDSRTAGTQLRQALVVSVCVCLGFALVYAAVIAVLFTLGSRLLWNLLLLEFVVGSLLVGLGLSLAISPSSRSWITVPLPRRRRSYASYVSFGVVYAAAAVGCTAPVFLSIATLSLNQGPEGIVVGLGSYALGMSALLLLVTLLASVGRLTLLSTLSNDPTRLLRLTGVLLALAGAYQLYLFFFRYDGASLLPLV
ncbi:cytochrome c biogenesis CcdA family protein [Natronobiforma cellulositropha]|uniref:cytochrome c biogenesis CcdA family protein n=1 Tax=Natronobiforma cellulositropha TaxID=1679076 RepID=UPI0021D5A257|nr:cytochrome c biogenesis protein CcdA [Natronobiforma cellulositropha]